MPTVDTVIASPEYRKTITREERITRRWLTELATSADPEDRDLGRFLRAQDRALGRFLRAKHRGE